MNQLISRRLGIVLVALVCVMLVPTFIIAQSDVNPPIPHPVEGRDDCLGCHATGTLGAELVPDNHSGIKNEICLVCHKSNVAPTFDGPQSIPHTVAGFENCQDCHLPEGDGPPTDLAGVAAPRVPVA